MTTNLKQISPLTFALERIFYVLQFTSLANILFGTRVKAIVNGEGAILKRARYIEGYSCLWVLLDIVCAFVVANGLTGFVFIAAWISAFHIFEMCHAAINIGVFDTLRISTRVPVRIASLERVLILTTANFVQISVCFATFYFAYSSYFDPAKPLTTWWDAFYFSSATQLTIGYGDILPLGAFRSVAAMQGFMGFFFAIAVLARFVSLLPRISPLNKNDKTIGAKSNQP